MPPATTFLSKLWTEFTERVRGADRKKPIAMTWLFMLFHSLYATSLILVSAYFFPALGFTESAGVNWWSLPLAFSVFLCWGWLVRTFDELNAGISGFRLRSALLVLLFVPLSLVATAEFSWSLLLLNFGYGFVAGTVFETYCHPLLATEYRNESHAKLVLERWMTNVKFALTFGIAIFLGIILGIVNSAQSLYRPAMIGIGPLIGIASLFVYWNWKHIAVEHEIERQNLGRT